MVSGHELHDSISVVTYSTRVEDNLENHEETTMDDKTMDDKIFDDNTIDDTTMDDKTTDDKTIDVAMETNM
jgi:hypothetical protein